MDLDISNSDECYDTALQIFEYCGVNNTGVIRVESLMDKFGPSMKSNETEYTILCSVLDPEKINPEISVEDLARALGICTNSQKLKVDLDESFNLKSGQTPLDSDSGISTDGFQLLEEVQCELREKTHLASQLRNQLEFCDRQHEEALAALTAERDTLRTHLNIIREENASLNTARRDCEEAYEKLSVCDAAREQAVRELDVARRRLHIQHEQLSCLESDKLTLQEQLSKSKDECHRINEMYASRQSALLEQNEALKAEFADLSSRLQDQGDVMQQILKEKVVLEMELKDALNRSVIVPRIERSFDVSCTDDQLLAALDSLNSDTRLAPENVFDDEVFINSLKEDEGRTNMSIFDEIRLSISNLSLKNDIGLMSDKSHTSVSLTDAEMQTDEIAPYTHNNNVEIACDDCKTNCLECEKLRDYAADLESDLGRSKAAVDGMRSDLASYETNLQLLQDYADEGDKTNVLLKNVVDELNFKLLAIEVACERQNSRLDSLRPVTTSAQCQTECDVINVATQADAPCAECEKRIVNTPSSKNWKRYIWEPLKSILSILACFCLMAALVLLYNVSNYEAAARRCVRAGTVPWRWLALHDLLDFVFRIEYVGEVPM